MHLLIPAERLDELPHALSTVKLGDSLASYETIRMRKDGRKISVSLTESPIRGENGRFAGGLRRRPGDPAGLTQPHLLGQG